MNIQKFKYTIWLAGLAVVLLTTGCLKQTAKESDGSGDKQVTQEEKEKILDDLKKAKYDVQQSINELEDKLNINEGPIERNFEIAMNALKEKNAELDETITDVNESIDEDWKKVKTKAEKTLTEIQKDVKRVKEQIVETWKEVSDKEGNS